MITDVLFEAQHNIRRYLTDDEPYRRWYGTPETRKRIEKCLKEMNSLQVWLGGFDIPPPSKPRRQRTPKASEPKPQEPSVWPAPDVAAEIVERQAEAKS